MTQIDGEMLYRELLLLDSRLGELCRLQDETLEIAKAMNREAAEWRAKIDIAKANYGMGRSEQRRCPK